MKDLNKVSQPRLAGHEAQKASGKAPAQDLAHGLFGRRLASPADPALEKASLTGKAA